MIGNASVVFPLSTELGETARAAWTGGMKSMRAVSPLHGLIFTDLALSFGSYLKTQVLVPTCKTNSPWVHQGGTHFARSIKKRNRLFDDDNKVRDLFSFLFKRDDCAPLKMSSPMCTRSGLAELSNQANPHIACPGCFVRILVRIARTTSAVSLFPCPMRETSCGIAV